MVEVTNLSSVTETESFRVDGLGNARLLVARCTLDRYPEIPKVDPIQDLESQLRELQIEKTTREQEVTISKASGKDVVEKPDPPPDHAGASSDALFDKTLACAEIARDLEERIARLNQRVNKIQNLKVGATCTKATITILAHEDGLVQLRLIYRKGNGA